VGVEYRQLVREHVGPSLDRHLGRRLSGAGGQGRNQSEGEQPLATNEIMHG
jgi:hypothetical protein